MLYNIGVTEIYGPVSTYSTPSTSAPAHFLVEVEQNQNILCAPAPIHAPLPIGGEDESWR